jgi:uncharacterized cupredoxin-like copper-binding protein
MSFARRVLIAALLIQVVGFLREIFFAIGVERYLQALVGGSDPTIIVATGVFVGVLVLLAPVWRGNRWATLATVPLMGLLLLAVLPVFGTMFGSPTSGNFAVWLTLTIILVAAAIGIPFAVIATLESFGRRTPRPALVGSLFSPSALFVSAAGGALVGMTLLAVAVAATPASGGTLPSGAPDDYASIALRNVRFEPADLRLAGGQTTAVFVVNEDGFDHSFDIDALDIHVRIPGGQTSVVMFTPEVGETFEIYCAIPGHTEAGMVGRLVAD